MRPEYQKQYEDKIIEITGDPEVDDVLTDLNVAGDFDNSLSNLDLQEARRQKIIKETEYLSQKITAKKEQLFSVETADAQQVLLRDVAYANPRVYVNGLTPPEIEPNNYYDKEEVDSMLAEVETKIPINTSDLFNDSNFVDNNSLEDALELYVKKTELVFRD